MVWYSGRCLEKGAPFFLFVSLIKLVFSLSVPPRQHVVGTDLRSDCRVLSLTYLSVRVNGRLRSAGVRECGVMG